MVSPDDATESWTVLAADWAPVELFAARSGCDATSTWERGVVERVSTGLLATAIGLQPVGSEMLVAAGAIASAFG